MKKIVAIVLIVCFIFTSFGCNQNTGKSKEKIKDKYTVAFNGETFDYAGDFDSGYTVVQEEENYYFIDIDGNKVAELPTQAEYQQLYNSGNPVALAGYFYIGQGICQPQVFSSNNTEMVFDITGKGMQTNLDTAQDNNGNWFHEGMIIINGLNGDGTHIKDVYGNEDFSLPDPSVLFYYGNIQFGYIDDKGKLVLPKELNFTEKEKWIYSLYSYNEENEEGYDPIVCYLDKNFKYIINTDGTKFSTDSDKPIGTKENMLIFYDGIAKLNQGEYINTGNKILKSSNPHLDWQENKDFSEGYAAVSVDDQWGYIDKNGEMVVEPQFQFASDIHNGLACVRLWDGKYQYLKIGESNISKSELNKNVILLENKNVVAPIDIHNDNAIGSSSENKGIDFIGMTFSEIESALGTKLIAIDPLYGGGKDYYYGSLDSNYIRFGFPFDTTGDVPSDTKVAFISVTGNWPIDDQISVGMSIYDLEKVVGKLDFDYYDEEGCWTASTTLKNGLDASVMSYDRSIVDAIEIWDK